LLPLPYNFISEYAFGKVQKDQECLELNEAHKFLNCAADDNLLGENEPTIKKIYKLYQKLVRKLIQK
jgi:hypothetical protein